MTVAVTRCAVPDTVPSVNWVVARPVAPIGTDACVTLPFPCVTANPMLPLATEPGTTFPWLSCASTSSAVPSCVPTVPVCASPPVLASCATTCATVTLAFALCVPDVAVTCVCPFATAVTIPFVVPTVAMAGFALFHVTVWPVMACPLWSLTVAVIVWLAPKRVQGDRGGTQRDGRGDRNRRAAFAAGGKRHGGGREQGGRTRVVHRDSW